MKKIIFFNLAFIILLIIFSEIMLRSIFNINVQGISKNLINTNLDYTFNNINLKNAKAFGSDIFTDENGFRVSRDSKLRSSNENILFIGGSVTFGPAVSAEETFVGLLNTYSKIEIKNASAFGSDLDNHYKILRNLDLLNTKKIFISFSLDDINDSDIFLREDIITEKTFKDKLKSNYLVSKIAHYLRSNSAIYVLAKNIIFDNKNRYYLNDLSLYTNKKLIDKMNKDLKLISKEFSKNNEIYFFLIPYSPQVSLNNCKKKDIAENIILESLKKYKFNTIYLKEDFCSEEKNKNFFLKFDHAHLSSKGHKFVFDKLKQYLN